jgi:hypothetical protein
MRFISEIQSQALGPTTASDIHCKSALDRAISLLRSFRIGSVISG